MRATKKNPRLVGNYKVTGWSRVFRVGPLSLELEHLYYDGKTEVYSLAVTASGGFDQTIAGDVASRFTSVLSHYSVDGDQGTHTGQQDCTSIADAVNRAEAAVAGALLPWAQRGRLGGWGLTDDQQVALDRYLTYGLRGS